MVPLPRDSPARVRDRVEPFPALNSFFSKQDAEGAQTRAVRALVEGWRAQSGVLVLVTHQLNITALTGLYPAEGEILVLRPSPTAGFDLVAGSDHRPASLNRARLARYG